MSETLFKLIVPQWSAEMSLAESKAYLEENQKKGSMMSLYNECKKEFTKRQILSCMKKEQKLRLIKELAPLAEYSDSLDEQIRQIINPKRVMFITINPDPKVSLDTFTKVVHKYADRKMFSRVLYCFEQRGTTAKNDIGKGFHCHLLIQRAEGYPPNKIKKNTLSTFKLLIGSEQSLDYGKGRQNVANRQGYIIGAKKDKKDSSDKADKQLADVVWRKKHKIDPYYGELFS